MGCSRNELAFLCTRDPRIPKLGAVANAPDKCETAERKPTPRFAKLAGYETPAFASCCSSRLLLRGADTDLSLLEERAWLGTGVCLATIARSFSSDIFQLRQFSHFERSGGALLSIQPVSIRPKAWQ